MDVVLGWLHSRLKYLGVRVALFRVPRSYTLLGFLDDPATAKTRYSRPPGTRWLDMDLDGMNDSLKDLYPGALIFEFHNGEDTDRIFDIDPGKPVRDYELGPVAPDFIRPYEIGTWRNIDQQGRPSKYLIEMPAAYACVDRDRLLRRRSRLQRLRSEGLEFEARWMSYLEREADVEASRRKGYLDDCLALKVADWIISRRDADH